MLTVLALSLATTTGMVVLMPVEGADVLPAVRTTVDGALREVAARHLGSRLQPAEDTEAVVADAVASGLNCSLREVSCGAQIGAIAGAAEVLLPVVQSGPDGRLELTIQRLDVVRASALAVAATVVKLTNRSALEAFVVTTMDPPALIAIEVDGVVPGAVVVVDDVPAGKLPLAGPVALTVGPHVVAVVDAAGVVVHQRALTTSTGFQRVAFAPAVQAPLSTPSPTASAAPPPLMIAGLVTTGVGGITAIATGVLAAVTEVGLAEPRSGARGYTDDRDFGRLMLGTAVVGVVITAGGTALMFVGGEP